MGSLSHAPSTTCCRYPQRAPQITFLKWMRSSWWTANTVPTQHSLIQPWKPSKAEAISLCEYKPSTFLSDGSSFLFWYYVFVWSVWKWKAFRQQKVTAWKFHCFAVLKPCYFVGFSSGKSNMVFYIMNRIAKRKSTSLPSPIVFIVLWFTGINIYQQSEKTSEVL